MRKNIYLMSRKIILTVILVFLPFSGSGGGLGDILSNPVGSVVSYITEPSIDNLDNKLERRGMALILEAREQLDSTLMARLNDLDKWSKLTIADASAQIKMAAYQAEVDFYAKLDARTEKINDDMYTQQGLLSRGLNSTVAVLQSSLLVVASFSALLVCLAYFGVRISNFKWKKSFSYKKGVFVIVGLFITLIIAIKAGGWYIHKSIISAQRLELKKAVAPEIRDFNLASFRAGQIQMLATPDSKEEKDANKIAEKYEIIRVFFNRRNLLSSETQFINFSNAILSAVQHQWVNGKNIDKDLMTIFAMLTFGNKNRARADEFTAAQFAATALSKGENTPLWTSTFQKPALAILNLYLTRPLTAEEMNIFFPSNAKLLKENIPSLNVYNLEELRGISVKDEEEKNGLANLVRNHVLKTNSLYFRVINWNLKNVATGSDIRSGQLQLIEDIKSNNAEWVQILNSNAYKNAQLPEKLKLLTIPYAIQIRLLDYGISLKDNTLNLPKEGMMCKSAVTRVSPDILRSPDTRSADRRLPGFGNSNAVIEDTVNRLIQDGSLTELSGFALTRTIEESTSIYYQELYKMEQSWYIATKSPGEIDINCDLLGSNYICPPKISKKERVIRGVNLGDGIPPIDDIIEYDEKTPVGECIPEEAKVKYDEKIIQSNLQSLLRLSALSGLTSCTTKDCGEVDSYQPFFRIIQNGSNEKVDDDKTKELYQLYSNALWVGTF
ncbi:hypothetical protein L386_01302 [Klebsiella variicola]|nr:hypothetical protein L386_01302 [Klebsiella variicola]